MENENNPTFLYTWNLEHHHHRVAVASAASDWCIRGLEKHRSPAVARQVQRRKSLVLEAVLTEQWKQQKKAVYCSDRLGNASSLYSCLCQQEALDRAKLDRLSVIRMDMETEVDKDEWHGEVEKGSGCFGSYMNQLGCYTNQPLPRDIASNVYVAHADQEKTPWSWWSLSSGNICFFPSFTSLLSLMMTPALYIAGSSSPRRT